MRQVMDRLKQRVSNMVARAVVRMVDDSTMLQQLQVSLQAKEIRNAERFQQYGFSSVPLADAEAVLLFPGGHRDHVIAIAVDDRRYRPKDLEAGELGLYHFEGDYIRLLNGRIIEVVAGTALNVTAPEVTVTASTKVTLDTPLCEMTGDLTVSGDATVTGQVQGGTVRTAAGIQLGTHVHSGVQSGGSNTGVPV